MRTNVQAISTALVVLLSLVSTVQGKRRHHKQDCKECDQRRCPSVYLHNCNGKIVPDRCGCCSICSTGMVPYTTTHVPKDDKCSKITCTKGKICVLNIQGIPICRCPSAFMCPKRKDKEICGKDGITYSSRCHLRIFECTNIKKIRVAHKGPCKTADGKIKQPLPLPAPARRRKLNKLNKQKEKATHQVYKSRDRDQTYKPGDRGATYNPTDRHQVHNHRDRSQLYKPGDRGLSIPRSRGLNKQRSRDRKKKRKGKDRMLANHRNRDRDAGLQRHRIRRRYRSGRRNQFIQSS